MAKSKNRKDQKKRSAARTKLIMEKRKHVQKLVAELETEFAKLQAPEVSVAEPFYQPPLLTLTPTK
jgi:hypothetical protein